MGDNIARSSSGLPMATPYDKRFGFLVSDIGRLMSTEFDRRARGRLELSRAQCRLALYLSFLGPMTQAQLAETLDVTPMTVARMLDRMQEGAGSRACRCPVTGGHSVSRPRPRPSPCWRRR